MLWDTQTFEPSYSMAWDKKGKLWKFWQWQKKWSEEMTEPTIKEMNVGRLVFPANSNNHSFKLPFFNHGAILQCLGLREL